MPKKQLRPLPAAALLAAALAVAAAPLGGCGAHRRGVREPPEWREEGLASWYGRDFHGRRTANGERYNMHAMTAAHKTCSYTLSGGSGCT